MTKEQYIELLNERSGGEWHPNIIAAMVEKVLSNLFYSTFSTDPQKLIKYCTEFKVNVLSEDGLYYSVLPSPIVDVAGPTGGVRMIQPLRDENIDFRPVTISQWAIMKTLEVVKVQRAIRYMKIENQIRYRGRLIENLKQVRMFILVPFSQLDYEAELNIPAGVEVELTKNVLQLLQNKPIDDIINDANEKTK